MSRERTRPTRDETRQRLIDAAAHVFAEIGVAGASVEQITAAAGFSRGAFYSNFSSKEELAVAMLDDHLAVSQTYNRALLARHPDALGFVDALREDAGRDDPLHRNPLLQVELMLHVARTPELRPVLGQHLRTMRHLVGEIATATMRTEHSVVDIEPDLLGIAIVALEDGLRLHRMIDPESTSPDAFLDVLEMLHRLLTSER